MRHTTSTASLKSAHHLQARRKGLSNGTSTLRFSLASTRADMSCTSRKTSARTGSALPMCLVVATLPCSHRQCLKRAWKPRKRFHPGAAINTTDRCGVDMVAILPSCPKFSDQGPAMLTVEEVLSDVAETPEFSQLDEVTPRSRGVNGETPLHWMATLGDSRGIELLIQAGAEVDAVDNNGTTPLHEAVAARQLAAVRALICAGATFDLRNGEGKTPLELALEEGFKPVLEFLEQLSLKGELNRPGFRGGSPG